MVRRVIEKKWISIDREPLSIITIYENGVSKQDIKQDWSKRKSGGVIVGNGQALDFIEK
ncbi:hypothetical protein [Priestia megaterium]|uniref:hypothetical protein n=1 Tax=Priestia megaterium TaxID=1404 RepID=UPI001ABF4E82|nr:hypothetical protein [Priestia megaterium]